MLFISAHAFQTFSLVLPRLSRCFFYRCPLFLIQFSLCCASPAISPLKCARDVTQSIKFLQSKAINVLNWMLTVSSRLEKKKMAHILQV